MRIICISGKAQHGKDTTAGILREHLEADGYSVLTAHYADLLKYICRQYFGWNGEKDEVGRHMLQYVGSDVIRAQDPEYFTGFLAGLLALFPDEWDYVLIPDCRFPNEIERMRQTGMDVTHLRVVRENFTSQLTPEQLAHPSETALDDYPYDCIISNNGGMEDLRKAVTALAHLIKGGSHETSDDPV